MVRHSPRLTLLSTLSKVLFPTLCHYISTDSEREKKKKERKKYGRENPHNRYNISKVKLNRSEWGRDLGVQVSLDLHPRKQCIEARNRANRVLGLIARSVKNRNAEVILKLYLALVRPHLDYAVQCSFDPRIIEWI